MVESSVKIISVSFVRPFRMDYTYGTILEETHIDRDTVTREMRVQNVVDSSLRSLSNFKGGHRRFAVTKNNFSSHYFVSLLRVIALRSLSSIFHASPVTKVHKDSKPALSQWRCFRNCERNFYVSSKDIFVRINIYVYLWGKKKKKKHAWKRIKIRKIYARSSKYY